MKSTLSPAQNPSAKERIFGWLTRNQWLAVAVLCVALGGMVGLAASAVNPLYLLGAMAIGLASLWALKDARRGLLIIIAVIALLPRIASPVSIGFKPTLLDGGLILTFGAWLLFGRGARAQAPSPASAITWPMLALIGVAIATFIVGIPNGALTTLVIRRFAELVGTLLMVFVFVDILSWRGMMRRAVQGIIVFGAMAALIGIFFYLINNDLAIRLLSSLRVFAYPYGDGVLRFVNDDPAGLKRAIGLWIDPNAFGGYLMITGAIALAQAFSPKPVLPRLVVFGCLGLIGLTLVLTVSRSAMLGLAFAALFMAAFKYRRLIPVMLIALALILILPQTRNLVQHFAEGFAGKDLATQMRFGEYKDAFRLIERYPVFGVGFTDTPDVDLYIGVSSMYLLIAQQMGLAGLTAFVLVMLAFLVDGFRAWPRIRAQEPRAAIWLGAFGAILGALLSGVLDHYFFNIDFHNSVTLFWLTASLAMTAKQQDSKGLTDF
ncbi:MAG TPA: O-antigen ligase family protein [Thermoflexales bacterium]|nr:O-antigen ligase family protein [Thermoflexales bacterium]